MQKKDLFSPQAWRGDDGAREAMPYPDQWPALHIGAVVEVGHPNVGSIELSIGCAELNGRNQRSGAKRRVKMRVIGAT